MDLFAPIRNYCERSADTLFSEPLNAITNLAFFIAAWFLWKVYKEHDKRDWQILTLICLIGLVGAGSTLFHTFANGLTMLADIIPIAMFTFFYLWVALRHLLKFSRFLSTLLLVLFALIASQMGLVPDAYRFNGSVDYFPCLAALIIIGLLLKKQCHMAANNILFAAAIFVLSLTFRSIDYHICSAVPVGSHFLWHSLNGLMLYLLVRPFVATRTSIIQK